MYFDANSSQRREDVNMEHSQLVSELETRNNDVTIHNFTSNNVNNSNIIGIERGERQRSQLPYRSQHITQVCDSIYLII